MKPFKFHPDAEVELYAQRDFYEEFDDKIVIWAVAHTKRFPGYWRERLK